MLAEIGSATVHVVPWETGVLFAYPNLRWDPIPIFQDYAAYTEDLDDRNADALASARRPKFILRQPGNAIDGRLARFESPNENVELLCRYRVVDEVKKWQLLRSGRDRCGRTVEGATRILRLGEVTSAPARPDEVIVARFSGIAGSLEDRVETLLLRGPHYFIGPGGAGDPTWKLLAETQGSWHVLTAPACAAAELAKTGPPFPRFAVFDDSATGSSDATYQVQFARIPYSCRPAHPA
jgi:hypothetical protein